VALSTDETSLLDELFQELQTRSNRDELLLRYYQGRQRIEMLGLAIPPSLRHFQVVANWPRVLVDTIERRQKVRSLVLPGEETADPRLQAIWDASNLSAHLRMFNRDRLIYGRAFLSVGSNERDASLPLVRVESPREMVVRIDYRHEVVTAAARFYGSTDTSIMPTHATLYLPDVTVWLERDNAGSSQWVEVDRDEHDLGQVPIVMHLNRRMTGSWEGESEMSDIIPIADSAARTLTDMQFAIDAHGAPRIWMTGVARGDFVDAQGKPIPQFEAYYNAIHTLTNKDARIGQLTPSDLKNFETAITIYGKQASTVSGFPGRYFGLLTTNPPAEGAIRADETQLVESVEGQNEETGMTLGWAAALAWRFSTGEWVEGNRIRVDWHDPATPTYSQRMDALVKARQVGAISREGLWDELGWSEARKAKERKYFEQERLESADPTLERISRDLTAYTGQ